jgi:hypothetical protein
MTLKYTHSTFSSSNKNISSPPGTLANQYSSQSFSTHLYPFPPHAGKCNMKVKVKVLPKQGMQAQSGSRGIPVDLLLLNFHARLGHVVNEML